MSAAALLAQAPALTAGRYLQLRRLAQGVSLEEAARAYAFTPIGARSAELLLADAERDRDRFVLGEPGLRRLQAAFRFDVRIYLVLAGEEDLPLPSLCQLCGCHWDDACVDERGIGCSWANLEETLCSACAHPGSTR